MLPLDNVWSSPVKGDAPAHDDEDDEDDEDDDAGSEEMELADPSSKLGLRYAYETTMLTQLQVLDPDHAPSSRTSTAFNTPHSADHRPSTTRARRR